MCLYVCVCVFLLWFFPTVEEETNEASEEEAQENEAEI
jgi:hypothetical protein